MKNLILLLVFALWSGYACVNPGRNSAAEVQNPFLTPEVMCGTVEFTDGCSESLDTLIRFGLALIHHMTYEDAAYTFDQVIQKDPDCFWGHWGKAMTYIHPLWPDAPTEQEMASGLTLAQRALSLADTDKEKLYGAALLAFYQPGEKNKRERMVDFQQGWAKATAQLPDDPEAALFNGLFRLGTVSPADKSFMVQREVGEMAEGFLKVYPDHPGAFHYGIHAYDVPPLAPKALDLARSYGKIAPEIPHALHMPSHIFTRLGYWQESIDWNTRSAVAAARMPYSGQASPHLFHALDYEVYARLQLGEDEKAREILQSIDTIEETFYVGPTTAYALAAMPARIPLENHEWDVAAAVPLPDTARFPWGKFPQWEALAHFGKGIGAARSGNVPVAQQALDRLVALQTRLGDGAPTRFWYDQMEAQQLSIRAWILFHEGKTGEALALMTQSADLEDGTQKNPVSPGELLPARELLGDMLLAAKQYQPALSAYEACLQNRPNRFNSLYGAGLAAEGMRDVGKARSYYTQVLNLKGSTPSTRERLVHARNMAQAG